MLQLTQLAMAAATTSPTVESQQAFSTANALTALLTTESLLFAALAATVALSGETDFGTPLLTPPLAFALVVAGVISFASVGALAAWIDVIGWTPDGLTGFLAGYALLAVIVLEPLAAFWVALALRNRA